MLDEYTRNTFDMVGKALVAYFRHRIALPSDTRHPTEDRVDSALCFSSSANSIYLFGGTNLKREAAFNDIFRFDLVGLIESFNKFLSSIGSIVLVKGDGQRQSTPTKGSSHHDSMGFELSRSLWRSRA